MAKDFLIKKGTKEYEEIMEYMLDLYTNLSDMEVGYDQVIDLIQDYEYPNETDTIDSQLVLDIMVKNLSTVKNIINIILKQTVAVA